MHRFRMLHRDIKPSNVLLCERAQPDSAHHMHGHAYSPPPPILKLADFGLSRAFSSKTFEATSCVGTPYYMSPECMKQGGYTFSSDIWSLGCLLYELVCGQSPFYVRFARPAVLHLSCMAQMYLEPWLPAARACLQKYPHFCVLFPCTAVVQSSDICADCLRALFGCRLYERVCEQSPFCARFAHPAINDLVSCIAQIYNKPIIVRSLCRSNFQVNHRYKWTLDLGLHC